MPASARSATDGAETFRGRPTADDQAGVGGAGGTSASQCTAKGSAAAAQGLCNIPWIRVKTRRRAAAANHRPAVRETCTASQRSLETRQLASVITTCVAPEAAVT